MFKKFGINLDRAENANTYKILDIQSGAIYLCRNVEFYETKFIKSKDIDIFHINKEISENIENLNNIEFYQELILEDIIEDLENKSINLNVDNNTNDNTQSNT